jgi:hypothetical protein
MQRWQCSSLSVDLFDPKSEAVMCGVVLQGIQITKCFDGQFLRVNIALAIQPHLLQQKAFVENLLWSKPFFKWCAILKIQDLRSF